MGGSARLGEADPNPAPEPVERSGSFSADWALCLGCFLLPIVATSVSRLVLQDEPSPELIRFFRPVHLAITSGPGLLFMWVILRRGGALPGAARVAGARGVVRILGWASALVTMELFFNVLRYGSTPTEQASLAYLGLTVAFASVPLEQWASDLTGAVYEELARGVLVFAGASILPRTWARLAVASVYFGLTHLYQGPENALYHMMTTGFAFSLVMVHSKTIWPTLLAHVVVNAIVRGNEHHFGFVSF